VNPLDVSAERSVTRAVQAAGAALVEREIHRGSVRTLVAYFGGGLPRIPRIMMAIIAVHATATNRTVKLATPVATNLDPSRWYPIDLQIGLVIFDRVGPFFGRGCVTGLPVSPMSPGG